MAIVVVVSNANVSRNRLYLDGSARIRSLFALRERVREAPGVLRPLAPSAESCEPEGAKDLTARL
jgi:hypothetical protein